MTKGYESAIYIPGAGGLLDQSASMLSLCKLNEIDAADLRRFRIPCDIVVMLTGPKWGSPECDKVQLYVCFGLNCETILRLESWK